MVKFKLKGGPKGEGILEGIFKELNRTQVKALRREIRKLTGEKQPSHPRLRFLGQAILVALGFVGGTTFVQIRNAYPDVNPTGFDRKFAFQYPFVVSNNQPLVTFYVVTPSYEY